MVEHDCYGCVIQLEGDFMGRKTLTIQELASAIFSEMGLSSAWAEGGVKCRRLCPGGKWETCKVRLSVEFVAELPPAKRVELLPEEGEEK